MPVLEEGIRLLLERRSIRRFQPKPVPKQLIMRALDIARHAPSAKNRQPWTFIVVYDREKIEKMASAGRGASPLKEAPVAVAVVADPLTSPMTFLLDGSIASTYLWLALHAVGLGAVWVNSLRYDEYHDILGVPRDKVIVSVFAVGFPAEQPPMRNRKPLDGIVKFLE